MNIIQPSGFKIIRANNQFASMRTFGDREAAESFLGMFEEGCKIIEVQAIYEN